MVATYKTKKFNPWPKNSPKNQKVEARGQSRGPKNLPILWTAPNASQSRCIFQSFLRTTWLQKKMCLKVTTLREVEKQTEEEQESS